MDTKFCIHAVELGVALGSAKLCVQDQVGAGLGLGLVLGLVQPLRPTPTLVARPGNEFA